MDIPTLIEECDKDEQPISGVQYSVLDDGQNCIYGDQHWVASGGVIRDGSHEGRIQRRTVTVTYGPWTDDDPRVRRLEELIRNLPTPWAVGEMSEQYKAGANEMRKAILAVLAAERTPEQS